MIQDIRLEINNPRCTIAKIYAKAHIPRIFSTYNLKR